MAKLVTIPVAKAPLAAMDWASAVIQGMPLRDPVNMTDRQMQGHPLPMRLWDTVNETVDDELRVGVYPVTIVRYGVDKATGAALPSVTYIDRHGHTHRSRVTEFFPSEQEAKLARAQMLFGSLSDWSPTRRWEHAGQLVEKIKPNFEVLPCGTVVSRAMDRQGAIHEGIGHNYRIAVTRCFLACHYGPNISVLPSLASHGDHAY